MIKWHEEAKEKPEYGLDVLIWIDCENCRLDKDHSHICIAAQWNFPNSFQRGNYVEALPKDTFMAERYNKKAFEDHWSPIKPSHWAYVNSPFEDRNGRI